MVVAILGKGDISGDISAHLVQNGQQQPQNNCDVIVKSSSDVKALTYCDLKCIHIAGLGKTKNLPLHFNTRFNSHTI